MRIEDGFMIGTDWHTKRRVMINVACIETVDLDCGNQPPADRVYFREARRPHIDLQREE